MRARIPPAAAVAALAALAALAGCGHGDGSAPGTLASGTGALVAVSSDTTLTLVDVDARTLSPERLEELASGDPPLRLLRRGDRLVFWGRGGAYVTGAAVGERPRLAGEGYFLPSAREDRIWLFRGEQDHPLVAVEVDLEGREAGPPAPLPYRSPVAAVSSGIVLQDEEGRLLVWDPGRGEAVARLSGGFPVAARGDVLAWCDEECGAVAVTDLADGSERSVELPQGARARAYAGAFAQSGRVLAVPVQLGEQPGDPGAVLVADLASGERRLVGAGIGPAPASVAWSVSGDVLFFHLPEGRLFAYRPWEQEARLVPVELPRPVHGFAVLQRGPAAP